MKKLICNSGITVKTEYFNHQRAEQKIFFYVIINVQIPHKKGKINSVYLYKRQFTTYVISTLFIIHFKTVIQTFPSVCYVMNLLGLYWYCLFTVFLISSFSTYFTEALHSTMVTYSYKSIGFLQEEDLLIFKK